MCPTPTKAPWWLAGASLAILSIQSNFSPFTRLVANLVIWNLEVSLEDKVVIPAESYPLF